jgi:hypothetical protein
MNYETVDAYFKPLSQHLFESTEKNHPKTNQNNLYSDEFRTQGLLNMRQDAKNYTVMFV